jgi:thiamine transporter ThiT
MIQLEMDVPLCAECAAKENKIANVTWIPFFVAGLLACVLVFIPVWLIAPEGTTTQTLALPYVLGAAAGMLAGLLVGTLAEFGLKMLFTPTYGRLLLKRPLTVVSVFNDSEDLIGLSSRFTDGRKRLNLSFENDEIAREFVALNPQEKP